MTSEMSGDVSQVPCVVVPQVSGAVVSQVLCDRRHNKWAVTTVTPDSAAETATADGGCTHVSKALNIKIKLN